MSLINSGLVGNTHYNMFKKAKEQVQERWENLGVLKGLEGHTKENIAQLYENVATQLIKESTTTAGGDSTGSFETVVFPIVRRVFSKLLANEIVSVQAMNMPIGKLFFFLPQVSERLADGSHTSQSDNIPSCIVDGCSATTFQAKSLYDLFYNDGLYDHSKGKITLVSQKAGNTFVTLGSNGFTTVANLGAVPSAQDGTKRYAILAVTGFSSAGAGKLIGADGNEMDTESFLASLSVAYSGATALLTPTGDGQTIAAASALTSFNYRVVTQKYGKQIANYNNNICDANGVIYLEVDLSVPVAFAGDRTYDNYIGVRSSIAGSVSASDFVVSWSQYDDLELESEMGEVSFKLDEVLVSVTERKLRATWSPELAQDVNAFHNINAEAELTAILSEQIAAEIDREILRDIRNSSAWEKRWDYTGWRKTSTSVTSYTQKEWNQTLITMVNQINAQVHKATLRGGVNWVVVSSEISAILDDLEYFHVSNADAESDTYNMGMERVGSLMGRYQVYRDPMAPAKSMIMGHKGKSLLDSGYIYAPYVPLQLTPTLTNTFNFGNVKGIMTRYAKKVVNNRYYGKIVVDHVPTFDINELR